ncbi:hypothetical protein [Pigmentiphaga daeguensis]|uniref:Uncharacterized protein n=1 Tax=Pigmentiphaga daeguensis TaxID=414049 RepID=A0ABN1D6K7_9BURK
MKQVVRFVETKAVPRPIERRDAFAFRKDKGWCRVQRLAIWALRKIGAYYVEQATEVTQVVIDTDSVAESLYREQAELMRSFDLVPDEVLIGEEEFRELMGTPQIHSMMTFSVEVKYGSRDGGLYLMGMKVTVIPWMKGVLVLPRRVA